MTNNFKILNKYYLKNFNKNFNKNFITIRKPTMF